MRNQAKCPANLSRVLSIFNRLPGDELVDREIRSFFESTLPEAEDLEALHPATFKPARVKRFIEQARALQQKVDEMVSTLVGQQLVNELRHFSDGDNGLEILKLIHQAMTQRQILTALVESAQLIRSLPDHFKVRSGTFPVKEFERFYYFDSDFVLYSSSFPPITHLLITQSVSLDRLKICQVCEKFFWVKRKGSTSCSRKCSNTLSQRRYRATREGDKKEKNDTGIGRRRSNGD